MKSDERNKIVKDILKRNNLKVSVLYMKEFDSLSDLELLKKDGTNEVIARIKAYEKSADINKNSKSKIMNFLLVYYIPVPYENCSRIKTCQWFEKENEMHDFIIEKKREYPQGFIILDAIEILQERKIFDGGETERNLR